MCSDDLQRRSEPGVFLITGVCWLSQLGQIFLKKRPRERWWSRENGAKHSFVCPEDETEGQRSPICHSQDPHPGFLWWISRFCHFSPAYSQRQGFYLRPFFKARRLPQQNDQRTRSAPRARPDLWGNAPPI